MPKGTKNIERPTRSQVIPNMEDWPIYKLSARRYEFIQEVHKASLERTLQLLEDDKNLEEELAQTLYLERIRMTAKPWRADEPDEKRYWNDVKSKLMEYPEINQGPKNFHPGRVEIASSIISRYTNEISGTFDPSIYEFAKWMIPFGFSRLLKTSIGQNFKEKLTSQFSVKDRIELLGDLETIRSLCKDHTLVMVPTHISNLDSMLIGWGIQQLGLPAFIYGAGLNLFGIRILAYLMNRLGAYKVDRRKKNRFYLETLKMYSTLALHQGAHSLFFPGGTRSRSGAIERQLKLGLLGTAIDAQYLNYLNAKEGEPVKKIILVPVVMNYHFVLEAPSLIEHYLKQTGREQYLTENDPFSTSFKMGRFIVKFLTQSSKIYLSFGHCIDLFGHRVTADGKSLDSRGNEIDIRNYFVSDGKLKEDKQRNSEYNKMLGEYIAKIYSDYNIVISSYLVAFTAFEMLKKRFSRIDLYALFRLPKEDRVLPYAEFAATLEKVRQAIFKLEEKKKILTAPHIKELSTDDLIAHGLKNVGLYHDKRPLERDEETGYIVSPDLKLLFFYHNRLDGYELEQHI